MTAAAPVALVGVILATLAVTLAVLAAGMIRDEWSR